MLFKFTIAATVGLDCICSIIQIKRYNFNTEFNGYLMSIKMYLDSRLKSN